MLRDRAGCVTKGAKRVNVVALADTDPQYSPETAAGGIARFRINRKHRRRGVPLGSSALGVIEGTLTVARSQNFSNKWKRPHVEPLAIRPHPRTIFV
jgi:hypothetical protein